MASKERAKQKSTDKYFFYSPDDDISSDEDDEADGAVEYEVDEDDKSEACHHYQYNNIIIMPLILLLDYYTAKVLHLCSLCLFQQLLSKARYAAVTALPLSERGEKRRIFQVCLTHYDTLLLHVYIIIHACVYNRMYVDWLHSTLSTAIPADRRSAVQSSLLRQLSQRPSQGELKERNIIPQEKSKRDMQWEERKVELERKLSRRPTVKELRQKKILM